MSDGMRRELVYLSSHATNHYFIPNWGNIYTKFIKILEICKQFSENLANESGSVPCRGTVQPKSSLGRLMSYFTTACSLLLFIRCLLPVFNSQ